MDNLTQALLRIGQATRTIALDEARAVGLTPVQAQTLLFVSNTKSFATTVRQLAATLGATNASTVGVIDALVAKGLLRREPGEHDRRITLLRLTAEGQQACKRLGQWGHQLQAALQQLTAEQRQALESGLGAVIWSLRTSGHLTVAEPCRGCIYFAEDAAPGQPEPHYCRLIQQFLPEEEARKDCPEHTPPDQAGTPHRLARDDVDPDVRNG
ncbi:winged helix-turn-helix transcriptional regulator [Chloroflexia bacterium SDU3-3]|nr:winged helix-turn-helix transcriptional regulator [Chloroflexia bacterium SDU3-3]